MRHEGKGLGEPRTLWPSFATFALDPLQGPERVSQACGGERATRSPPRLDGSSPHSRAPGVLDSPHPPLLSEFLSGPGPGMGGEWGEVATTRVHTGVVARGRAQDC